MHELGYISKIRAVNSLSFGSIGVVLDLNQLNVLIGANGSGKSNLIEVFRLLKGCTGDFSEAIGSLGGLRELVWKGQRKGLPEIDTSFVAKVADGYRAIEHRIRLNESDAISFFDSEVLLEVRASHREPIAMFVRDARGGQIWRDDTREVVPLVDLNPYQSVFSQRRDPQAFSAMSLLEAVYSKVRIYGAWTFGPKSPTRIPQRADAKNDFLEEDCSNLGLVINRIRRDVQAKTKFLSKLKELSTDIIDVDVIIEAGTVQVFLQEGNFTIPAARLSDGTMRYLCLLAILCHPSPPPMICIEEPELGFHPDMLPSIARLLKETSERTQLIVTTHSDVLVDALSDSPEDIVVCEKQECRTTMKRLDKSELVEWLEKYSLGELWRRGQIGGNRW